MIQILLPETLKSIESFAFSECENLDTCEIPNGVTRIGASAFSGCKNLGQIIIPESVRSLETRIFRNSGLSRITLPKEISIAPASFENCENLTTVVYAGTQKEWKNRIVYTYGNEILHSATIHCTDGDILPTSTASENSITTGTASTSDSSSKPPLLMPRRARSMWCLSAAPAVTR